MDKKVKDRSWNREFQWLLDRKILSRDEMGYLLGQINSLLSEKEKKIEELKVWYEQFCLIREDKLKLSIRIKELEEGIEKYLDALFLSYTDEEGYLFPCIEEEELYKLIEKKGEINE